MSKGEGFLGFDEPIMTFDDPIRGVLEWAKNAKEWKEKGIIQGPKHEEMCTVIKSLYEELDLTLDEDGNVKQELDDKTIENIIDKFKKFWGFRNVEGIVAMTYLQKNILKDVKGNPKYIAEFLSILYTNFS